MTNSPLALPIEALVLDEGGEWLQFVQPSEILVAAAASEVAEVLARVDRVTRDRPRHAVGFVTYEAGTAFGLRVLPSSGDWPLAWFAVFDAPPTRLRHLSEWCPTPVGDGSDPTSTGVGAGSEVGRMTPNVSAEKFGQAFARVKAHIANGNTYQVNYTFRLDGHFTGDVRRLFSDLASAQQGRYAAYLRIGDRAICSASPELFFSRRGRTLTARPMKGTAPRGRTLPEDRLRRDALHASPKERAENVMIVDMTRNDLGRVADVGSVTVPQLLATERYPTVWQMTSTIAAESDARLDEIFAALHPPASVTGAPKVRTMEILTELEESPRGVYTGAIGLVRPGGDARFSVAIRTAVVDIASSRISYGVGSGIVWDSDASREYEECLLKAAILTRRPVAFELLETVRWTPRDGFFLLDRHLQRLGDSAEYFGFRCDRSAIRRQLDDAVAGAETPLRVRLLVAPTGEARVEGIPLPAGDAAPARVAIAPIPIDRDDVFLYHKTTHRTVYQQPRPLGVDDLILWNRDGQVTEATIANVVVELDGARVTPPIACGLLGGTFRAALLERGEIREAVLTRPDLARASRIWLINSVHEWRPATLAG